LLFAQVLKKTNNTDVILNGLWQGFKWPLAIFGAYLFLRLAIGPIFRAFARMMKR
jgi:hypothetical protein